MLVSLSIVFSLGVNAKSTEIPDYKVNIKAFITGIPGMTNFSLSEIDVFPNNEGREICKEGVQGLDASAFSFTYVNVYTFQSLNGEPLIVKGGQSTVELSGLFFGSDVNSYVDYTSMANHQVLLFYDDNTMEYASNVTKTILGPLQNLRFSITPGKNITKIEVTLRQIRNPQSVSSVFAIMGEQGNSTYRLIVDQLSEESGFLSGILNKVNQIFTSITELPQKIWSFIENGLKSLFVPSEEFIETFSSDINIMFSEKFGAVYEVVALTLESWDRIQANDEQNIITVPLTTIDLPDNQQFSFGGVDVPIVPEGFEFIVDILKVLVGIVCTILFVNGMRHKYEELMGVEK